MSKHTPGAMRAAELLYLETPWSFSLKGEERGQKIHQYAETIEKHTHAPEMLELLRDAANWLVILNAVTVEAMEGKNKKLHEIRALIAKIEGEE